VGMKQDRMWRRSFVLNSSLVLECLTFQN
jgi:hypothetical protein